MTIFRFRTMLAIAFSLAALSAWAVPNMVHQPPLEAQAGRSLEINVLVTDVASAIQQVRVFYRPGGTLGYQMQIMNGAGYNFSVQLPGSAVTAAGVDYYLEAKNQLGEQTTAPPLNASLAPYHVVAREAHAAPQLRLISPDLGSTILPEEAVVAVAMQADGSRLDLKTLSVIVDEQDVTAKCRISETLLTYVLPESSADGLHGVRVSVRNSDGVEGKSPTWTFTLKRSAGAVYQREQSKEAKKEARAKINGALSTDLQYTAMTKESSADTYYYQPRGWLNRATLNLNGFLGSMNFLTSAYVTSEETPGRQPVDRFRMELYDDAFNATLGDMYPVFSMLSLNNLYVRGAGLSLMAGRADTSFSKFQVVGGKTRQAIDGRDSSAPGTYEQWLWATRWVYNFLPGTGFALNYSTINDYANSIQTPGGTLPADNHVATAEMNIKIPWMEKLSTLLFGEGGVSYYDERQSLLNLSLGNAYRGGMRWDWGGRSFVQLEYKNTGANYVSLANPWLTGDWRGISGDGQMYFLDNALAIMLSGNSWHDNLDGQKNLKYVDAAGVTITAGTTTTTYLSGMLNYRISTYVPVLSLGYSFNRQQDDTQPKSMVDNRTGVLNGGLGIQIPMGSNQCLVNVTYSETKYNDLASPRLSADMTSSSLIGSLMYLLGPSWSFSGGYGKTNNQVLSSGLSPSTGSLPSTTLLTQDQTVDYTLANLRANWKVLPGILDVGAGWETLAGKDNLSRIDNQLTTLSCQSTWYFNSSQNIGLKLSSADYRDQITSAGSYTEFIVNLHYGIIF
jgi:hypothetical protein